MSDSVNRKIAGDQVDQQAATRQALLKQIAQAASAPSTASYIRDLAEAYALVVAPERSTTSATATASK